MIPPSLIFGHEMLSSIGGDALGIGQNLRQLDVFLDGRPADVDDDDRVARLEVRELLTDETMHADALEADGIQHPGGRLDDP